MNYLLILFLLFLSNCQNVQKGYKIDIEDEKAFQEMVDKKASMNDFLNRFGSPTFVNSPINDTICYIDAKGKKIAFNRFYKPTYLYQCIVFDNNNIAIKLIKKTITKIEKQKMTKYNIKLEKPL